MQQGETAVEEAHVSRAFNEVFLTDRLEVGDGERLDVFDLVHQMVRCVLVAFERHAQVDLLPYDVGGGAVRGDGRVLAECVVQHRARTVVHLRGVQNPRNLIEPRVVENRVELLVSAVEETQNRHRLFTVVRRCLRYHAEARLELGVVPELVLDFLHLLQVCLCEHVAVVSLEEQLKNVSSLRPCQLRTRN